MDDEHELRIIATMQTLKRVSRGNIDSDVLLQPTILRSGKQGLARRRATATNRSYEAVLLEVELGFMVQLGRILARDAKDILCLRD
ncbi:conserved hypothetical protein [Ricinus communis]|uniref:Uncharacterized protein n=1 Tax=Ricinus communis TaxID=3988 RepID=B9SM28_RICCO|nr:conserved hypothetical protein [Ricinus communis]